MHVSAHRRARVPPSMRPERACSVRVDPLALSLVTVNGIVQTRRGAREPRARHRGRRVVHAAARVGSNRRATRESIRRRSSRGGLRRERHRRGIGCVRLWGSRAAVRGRPRRRHRATLRLVFFHFRAPRCKSASPRAPSSPQQAKCSGTARACRWSTARGRGRAHRRDGRRAPVYPRDRRAAPLELGRAVHACLDVVERATAAGTDRHPRPSLRCARGGGVIGSWDALRRCISSRDDVDATPCAAPWSGASTRRTAAAFEELSCSGPRSPCVAVGARR